MSADNADPHQQDLEPNQPPPATTELAAKSALPLLSSTPLTGTASSFRSPHTRTTSSERPRRGKDSFWGRVDGDRQKSPGLVAPARTKRENDGQPDGDVDMSDSTISKPTDLSSSSLVANKPINLVFRMPPATPVVNGSTAEQGSASASSTPAPVPAPATETASEVVNGATATGSKKKRKSEPPLNTTRVTRGRRSSPRLSTPRGQTSNEASPAPPGPLSIFAPPPPSDNLPEALQSALAPSTPAAGVDDSAPLVDADSIRREAAAGFESRLRSRTKNRDGAETTGVSASGKGVRVGGSSRAAAQQAAQSGPSKKKGKGKSGDVDIPNQDFCSACRGIGRFLCCDGCPRSFHFMCLEPPLRIDELPEEETWYCKECLAKRNEGDSDSPSRENQKELKPIPAVFREFYNRVEASNPKQYRLPSEVRLHFLGVGEVIESGVYVDSEEARTKYDRKGFQEDRDPFRTTHKNKPVHCYACAGSVLPSHNLTSDPGTAWRPIVSCDFCPLHWHLDCLDPPMSSMPNSGRKWMCPNHAEQVMPRRRTIKNGLEVVDVETPNTRNNGNITVVPDPDEPRLPPLEYEDMVINKRSFRVPERIIKLDFWEKLKTVKQSKIKADLIRRRAAEAAAAEDEDGDISMQPPSEEDMTAANLILGLLHARQAGPPTQPQPQPQPQLQDSQPSANGANGASTSSPKARTPATPVTSANKPNPRGYSHATAKGSTHTNGNVDVEMGTETLPLSPKTAQQAHQHQTQTQTQLATPVTALPPPITITTPTLPPTHMQIQTPAQGATPTPTPKIVLRMPGSNSTHTRSNGHGYGH